MISSVLLSVTDPAHYGDSRLVPRDGVDAAGGRPAAAPGRRGRRARAAQEPAQVAEAASRRQLRLRRETGDLPGGQGARQSGTQINRNSQFGMKKARENRLTIELDSATCVNHLIRRGICWRTWVGLTLISAVLHST